LPIYISLGDEASAQAALWSNIVRQQTKLHALFAGYGISDFSVDGISGPLTGQRLCAALRVSVSAWAQTPRLCSRPPQGQEINLMKNR
jgi:hypothetical protein